MSPLPSPRGSNIILGSVLDEGQTDADLVSSAGSFTPYSLDNTVFADWFLRYDRYAATTNAHQTRHNSRLIDSALQQQLPACCHQQTFVATVLVKKRPDVRPSSFAITFYSIS